MTKTEKVATDLAKEVVDLGVIGASATATGLEKLHDLIEQRVAPTRKSIARKYPTLFTIVAVVGAVLTYYGLESLIAKSIFWSNHPGLILIIGLGLLFITGRLIKQSYVQ